MSTAEDVFTHHVSLILDNDQGSYETVRDLMRENRGRYERAQALRALVEECVNDEDGAVIDSALSRELVMVALSHVDFYKLAEDHDDDEDADEAGDQ